MEIIRRYFPDLSVLQDQQLTRLEKLYSFWNQKINVISRKDIEHLYTRHVLHSLSIGKYVSFVPGSKILDVGTGGGFPGIPLATLFPDTDFLLIDSIAKKIRVVQAVIRELGLKNCRAEPIRAEAVSGKFDFIVSRAVTTLPRFIPWIRKSISVKQRNAVPNGLLALKGGDLSAELSIPYKVKCIDLSAYFSEDFFESKKLLHVILQPYSRGS